MYTKPKHFNPRFLALWFIIFIGISLACVRTLPSSEETSFIVPTQGEVVPTHTATPFLMLPPTRLPGEPVLTPTPDNPHQTQKLRSEPEKYIVQPGDTLGQIAEAYSISVEQIVKANDLANANVLDVGQTLKIPVADPEETGPSFKIIPDSELIYSPYTAFFDLPGFIKDQAGYLASYHEKIDDNNKLSGAEIIQLVAQNYSVNPRLLLALLEYQGQWVTKQNIDKAKQTYPMGWKDPQREGLYRQLAWTANQLNQGYYLWLVNGVVTWVLNDGRVVPIDATINAGTAGVQNFFAQFSGYQQWKNVVTQDGFISTYQRLFGYPFDLAFEPLLPEGLSQPVLQLPFEKGVKWAYTGGPHAGWDTGSAWAAIDFAPDNEALGCVPSGAWVVAVGDGLVIRSGDGIVLQDVEDPNGYPSDGLEQTGWVILYLHVATKDRITAGTYLKAGDRIGHPSCEGGIASGSHLHLARRYNGEWIPADQDLPFVLDGWVSSGSGQEYEGYLELGNQKIKADADITAKNNTLER
jgi:LasA protease